MYALKRLIAAFVVAALTVCITFTAVSVSDKAASAHTDASVSQSMHRSYREASDIVLASCTLTYADSTGSSVSRFTVNSVYGGSLVPGDTLTLPREAEVGESYLLYLAPGGGADYAEDESGFVSVTDELITVKGDTAVFGGSAYSLSSILDDFDEQRSVLTVPAQSFYYNDIASLASSCSDVVICRVVSVEGPFATQCRSNVKGESVSSTANLTYAELMVENSFGGSRAYGDIIRVALVPAHTLSVINAEDLASVQYPSPVKTPEVGRHAKSDCCFAVNPYQGYLELDGDSIIRPYYNRAAAELESVSQLAEIMRGLLGF